jgi:hypothetical protein
MRIGLADGVIEPPPSGGGKGIAKIGALLKHGTVGTTQKCLKGLGMSVNGFPIPTHSSFFNVIKFISFDLRSEKFRPLATHTENAKLLRVVMTFYALQKSLHAAQLYAIQFKRIMIKVRQRIARPSAPAANVNRQSQPT